VANFTAIGTNRLAVPPVKLTTVANQPALFLAANVLVLFLQPEIFNQSINQFWISTVA